MSLLLKKAIFEKPMTSGDSTLMMLLSLNLLLLVFFMLLNSMSTYGAKHAEDVLAQVRDGYAHSKADAAAAIQTPKDAWRETAMARLNGVLTNRIELRAPPQLGNANRIEMEFPMSAVFKDDGSLLRPEFLKNMVAAAGAESTLLWQVLAPRSDVERVLPMLMTLGRETGEVAYVAASEAFVKVIIVPGQATPAAMGLSVQRLGEDAGGLVQGVEAKGSNGL